MMDAGLMISPVGLASIVSSWTVLGGRFMTDKRVRSFSPEELERRRQRSRRFYEANRATILAQASTPEALEKRRAYAKGRYHADPEVREATKQYNAKWRSNPENRATIAEYNARYYASEGGQAVKRVDRLRRYFQMTVEQYDTMLAAQGGVCAICKQPETHRHRGTGVVVSLSVDHNHRCCPGKVSCGACVRGLLCDRCNVGRFPDDPELLRMAADYYERYI